MWNDSSSKLDEENKHETIWMYMFFLFNMLFILDVCVMTERSKNEQTFPSPAKWKPASVIYNSRWRAFFRQPINCNEDIINKIEPFKDSILLNKQVGSDLAWEKKTLWNTHKHMLLCILYALKSLILKQVFSFYTWLHTYQTMT